MKEWKKQRREVGKLEFERCNEVKLGKIGRRCEGFLKGKYERMVKVSWEVDWEGGRREAGKKEDVNIGS